MSVPAGELLDRIQAMVDDWSAEVKVDLLRHLNAAYAWLAEKRPWSTLVSQVTVSGTVLPGDMVMPVYAEDDTDQLYFRIGIPQRYFSQRLYNYFLNLGTTTPLYTGTDMATTINDATITSAGSAFTAANTEGEYIRIGQHPGIYKIATRTSGTALELDKVFHGADWTDPDIPANLTSQYFEVRPIGTKQIAYTDQSGDSITPSAFKLWYLRRPIPLYNDYDNIELPGTCEAVRIRVIQLMMETNKYDNDALKQVGNFEEAMEDMRKGEDVWFQRFVAPRDKLGQRCVFGRRRLGSPASIHEARSF